MDPRKQLLAAVGAIVVGIGASAASAKVVVVSDKDLCQLATTALRSGDQHSLQLALGHFPGEGQKLSKRALKCREQLAEALVELAIPASGPPDTTTNPGGGGGGGGGAGGGGGPPNHYG